MSGTADARLQAEFDRAALRYDLMVGLNPGYHRHLRDAALELIRRVDDGSETLRLLDLACGSGASTAALVAAAPDAVRILGVDFSAGMLRRARGKSWPPAVAFQAGRAGDLDTVALQRGTWDGVFAAYLFRNVPPDQRGAALNEAFDLLKPGGWIAIQEYSVAGDRRATAVWDAVCRLCVIPLAAVLRQDTGIYRYLRRSVLEFDALDEFCRCLENAGFTRVQAHTVPGWQHGILHTILAQKRRAP